MIGLLFLNGEPPAATTLAAIDFESCFVVCADGAYDYLKDYCVPDVFVGDFDSVLSVAGEDVEGKMLAKTVIKLPVDKDYTDGHVAMQHLIDRNPDEIIIYGATGKAADHELANYSLLYLASRFGINAVIKGEQFSIYFATKNSPQKELTAGFSGTSNFAIKDLVATKPAASTCVVGKFAACARIGARVSVVPFSDSVHIIRTAGLRYNIEDEYYDKCHIKGISNTAVSTHIDIELASGAALVFVEN